jgi:hypothetical protein
MEIYAFQIPKQKKQEIFICKTPATKQKTGGKRMEKDSCVTERNLQRVQAFRYMDDVFMTACLKDNIEGVELILRIVLQRQDIKVKSVQTQEVMKNLYGRSVCLDVHAVDSTDREFDVEIQRSDAGAGARRARYHSSLLDTNTLEQGKYFEALPDCYVIFITENDVMKGDQPLYPVERYVTIGEEQVLFGDGSHILYVNGQYRGNDEVGRLMHDFSCTDPDEMNYEALAGRARYFKQEQKGARQMGSVVDEIREEGIELGIEQTICKMLEKGYSCAKIADILDMEEAAVQKIQAKALQTV